MITSYRTVGSLSLAPLPVVEPAPEIVRSGPQAIDRRIRLAGLDRYARRPLPDEAAKFSPGGRDWMVVVEHFGKGITLRSLVPAQSNPTEPTD